MIPRPDDAVTPSARLPWPPILLAALIAAALALGHVAPIAWPGEDDAIAHVVGLGLGIAGLALMAWAAATLRRHKTTILPDKAAAALVTDGPYRFRRNPIYVAHILILLGVAEITHNIWFALAAAAYAPLVTWLAILPEERHLEARFGDAYHAYAAVTRRWI